MIYYHKVKQNSSSSLKSWGVKFVLYYLSFKSIHLVSIFKKNCTLYFCLDSIYLVLTTTISIYLKNMRLNSHLKFDPRVRPEM